MYVQFNNASGPCAMSRMALHDGLTISAGYKVVASLVRDQTHLTTYNCVGGYTYVTYCTAFQWYLQMHDIISLHHVVSSVLAMKRWSNQLGYLEVA